MLTNSLRRARLAWQVKAALRKGQKTIETEMAFLRLLERIGVD